jgi:UDP-N-acetylmuramoylalanine--D-glutamate ligase
MSSFQLETVSEFQARIAVCLNVTPDHLDRHYTFENYANAKARLFETQGADGFAILNADNETTASYAGRTKSQVLWFSTSHAVDRGAWHRPEDGRIFFDDTAVMLAKEIPLRGIHNVENSLAAVCAARCAGVPLPKIADAIRTFPGVEHRIEFVRELGGVRYYNDSKATNVDATEKAIDAFDEGLWLILGGKDKNSDYTVLFEKLQKKMRAGLLIGAAANIIARQLEGLPLVQCGTLEAAVRFAHAAAAPGEVVLLSPACASFDQFTSYEHRGRMFKEIVKGLQEK